MTVRFVIGKRSNSKDKLVVELSGKDINSMVEDLAAMYAGHRLLEYSVVENSNITL